MVKPKYTTEFYKAKDGIRWRIKHRNGNIVAEGGEGYKRLSSARNSLHRLVNAIWDPIDGGVVEVDSTKKK